MILDNATGKSDSHIAYKPLEAPVHKELVAPILRLKKDAAAQGFDLRIASGFRGFDRQLAIWNRKAGGQAAVLGGDGIPLKMNDLSEAEKVFAILRWSALPGGSRHHWGTDIDVYDASAIDENYKLQLTVAETCGCGPFAAFHRWLDHYLAASPEGFFRPYAFDSGGIAPEPWHLSYRPLAETFVALISRERLFRIIGSAEINLKATILDNFDVIFDRFVMNAGGGNRSC